MFLCAKLIKLLTIDLLKSSYVHFDLLRNKYVWIVPTAGCSSHSIGMVVSVWEI